MRTTVGQRDSKIAQHGVSGHTSYNLSLKEERKFPHFPPSLFELKPLLYILRLRSVGRLLMREYAKIHYFTPCSNREIVLNIVGDAYHEIK